MIATLGTTAAVRLLAALASVLGLVVFGVGAASAQQTGELVTKARNAILIDYETGATIFQKAADELVPPASMSKLMTVAVLFKSLRDGKVNASDEFTVSENAWRKGGAPSGTSAMFVPINTKARVDELIQGMIVQSGNDACIAVAEALAGTEANFTKMMTDEARRIGLAKSTFANSTGLPAEGHLMTARELAALARHIIRTYPELYKIFAQKEFQYKKYRFFNRNPLLGSELNVDGLKTGHTKDAGYGIVFSAVNDGRRLIGVVMGLGSEKERREESRKVLEWGIKSAASLKLFEADEEVGFARVWGGSRWYVPLTGNGPLEVVLPRFPANQKLKGEIVYAGPLKPPLKKGDEVARLRVSSLGPSGGEPTATSEVPLYAATDVEPAGFVWRGLDSLVYLALRWAHL